MQSVGEFYRVDMRIVFESINEDNGKIDTRVIYWEGDQYEHSRGENYTSALECTRLKHMTDLEYRQFRMTHNPELYNDMYLSVLRFNTTDTQDHMQQGVQYHPGPEYRMDALLKYIEGVAKKKIRTNRYLTVASFFYSTDMNNVVNKSAEAGWLSEIPVMEDHSDPSKN